MSTRASIITALDTRFKTITIANGYNTALGSAVYHWSPDNIPEEVCPALVYEDPTDKYSFATTKKTEHMLSLKIHLKYAVTAISDVYAGIEDVMDAMGTDDTLGGLLTRTIPRGNDYSVANQGQMIIVGAEIDIDLIYETTKWGL
jgi:hypothetical protein